MSVEFHEEEVPVMSRPMKFRKLSLFTRLVYTLKLANTEEGAQRIMLIASVAFLVAAVGVFLIF